MIFVLLYRNVKSRALDCYLSGFYRGSNGMLCVHVQGQFDTLILYFACSSWPSELPLVFPAHLNSVSSLT